MIWQRRYSFQNLMDRLTSDVWFVVKGPGETYVFAQMIK